MNNKESKDAERSIESTQDAKNLEADRDERQASPEASEGATKSLRRGRGKKGGSEWSKLVHSLGLSERQKGPNLFTKEGAPDD